MIDDAGAGCHGQHKVGKGDAVDYNVAARLTAVP